MASRYEASMNDMIAGVIVLAPVRSKMWRPMLAKNRMLLFLRT